MGYVRSAQRGNEASGRFCAMKTQPPSLEMFFVNPMFESAPSGNFAEGYVFLTGVNLETLRQGPANGYWHCDIANHNSLTWSEAVYELFGLPAGAPIKREWAVERYSKSSMDTLERVRKLSLTRDCGFILDAAIEGSGSAKRWIRVLALPIVENGRIVGLHGVKKGL